MPISYLEAPDTDVPFPPALDDEEEERRRVLSIPDSSNSSSSSLLPIRVGPPPDLQELLGVTPVGPAPKPPGTPPVVEEAEQARKALAEAKSSQPLPAQPKWWQRLAAAGIGAGAGWANAAGKMRTPIDATPAEQLMLGGLSFPRSLAEYQSRVNAAQARADAAEANLQAWWKNQSIQNQQELQEAEAQRNLQQAKYYGKVREQAEADRKAAQESKAAIEKDNQFIKGREQDAILFDPQKEQAPDGYIVKPSAANPGMMIAVPPRLMVLTPDLAPFAPGYKVGDRVPYSRWSAAQAAAQKAAVDKIQAGLKFPTNEYEGILQEFRKPDGTIDYAAANRAYLARQLQIKREGSSNALQTPGNVSQDLHGEEYLKTLPPGFAEQVKAIAEGRASMPSGTRNALAMNLRNAVFQYDPSYTDQRAQIRKYFTAGKAADNIRSLNTAALHLDQFHEAAQALKNGDMVRANQLWNLLATEMGRPEAVTFDALAAAVATEISSALKQTPTERDIEAIKSTIKNKFSTGQLNSVTSDYLHLIAARLKEYKESYESVMPNDTVWSPVLPSAKTVFRKHGIQLDNQQGPIREYRDKNGIMHVVTPSGVDYQITDPKLYEQLKTELKRRGVQ